MRKTRTPKTCPICGKIFEPATALVKKGFGIHCSAKCYGTSITGTKRPNNGAKIGAKLRGRPKPPGFAEHLSEMYKGDKSQFWKGGKTKELNLIRGTSEYRKWRRAILNRDGFKCIFCGSKERLHADHIKSFANHPEIRFDINNGRTLCERCHRKTLTYGNEWVRRWRNKNISNQEYII